MPRRLPTISTSTNPSVSSTRLTCHCGSADENQDAQNLFGGVRDRRQRVGREHRQAGGARQPFVMREMRRDRLADEKPFDLRKNSLFRHAGGRSKPFLCPMVPPQNRRKGALKGLFRTFLSVVGGVVAASRHRSDS